MIKFKNLHHKLLAGMFNFLCQVVLFHQNETHINDSFKDMHQFEQVLTWSSCIIRHLKINSKVFNLILTMQIYLSKSSFCTFQHTFEVEFKIVLLVPFQYCNCNYSNWSNLEKRNRQDLHLNFNIHKHALIRNALSLKILHLEIYVSFQRLENCLYHWRLLLNKHINSKFLI